MYIYMPMYAHRLVCDVIFIYVPLHTSICSFAYICLEKVTCLYIYIHKYNILYIHIQVQQLQ